MNKLPRGLSGRQVRRALERAGFYLKRQKGSQMVLP
jgi:predicted RNA binding protein YcfA (HicA-like mRNA interferase family)